MRFSSVAIDRRSEFLIKLKPFSLKMFLRKIPVEVYYGRSCSFPFREVRRRKFVMECFFKKTAAVTLPERTPA